MHGSACPPPREAMAAARATPLATANEVQATAMPSRTALYYSPGHPVYCIGHELLHGRWRVKRLTSPHNFRAINQEFCSTGSSQPSSMPLREG